MMTWKDVLEKLQTLTPTQLEKPAMVNFDCQQFKALEFVFDQQEPDEDGYPEPDRYTGKDYGDPDQLWLEVTD